MDDGKIIIKAQIDSSEVDSGLAQVEGKVNKSANNLMSMVKGLGITALIAKATQTAVKFAKEVNTATEAVSAKLKAASTLYQGVSVDQEKLLKNLSSIASETGQDLETLGQSVYDALSAGVKPTEDMADVLKVVEASAKLAKGGFTDTSTALSSTMKVMNAYSMEIKDLDRVQGILVQTQNSGITTVDELGASLAQVVPTAASFGVSFENVGAAIAEMTKQGTKTAQATTSLNAIIAELGKNGTKASKALSEAAENAGMADTDFQSMLDSGMNLSEILQLMSDNASANGLSLVDMFSSIEAGKGALQLTGKAGEDFNAIMDSMQESAGLVQEAFEKTVDPSERLSTSWNNLLVTLGTKFKPTADSVRDTLADMITKLNRNVSAGSDLEGKFYDVKDALAEYKKLQEESVGYTDALTTSMKLQAQVKLQDSLLSVANEYANTSKQTEDYATAIEKATQKQNELESEINETISFTGMSLEKIRELYVTDEEEFGKLFAGKAAALGVYLMKEEELGKVEDELIRTKSEYLKVQSTEEQFINLLTQGYIYEDEATLALLKRYPELNQEVLNNVEAYKELEKSKKDAANEGASGAGTGGGEETAIKDTIDLYKKLEKEHIEILNSYNNLEEASDENGLSMYDESQKLSELTSLYVKYAKLGLDPASSAMQNIAKQIKELTPAEEAEKDVLESLSEEVKNIVGNYDLLSDADEKLGTSMADKKKVVDELKSKFIEYVLKGVDPACDAMEEILKLIDEFDEKTGNASGSIRELTDDFKSLAKSSATNLAQGMGKAIEELAISLETQDLRLAKIDNQMKELGDETSGKLKDAINDVTDAQNELAIATERGDTVAIANAQKKVDKAIEIRNGISTQIENLKKERKEVETGVDSWKSFGKSALEALASTIEGLAAQLAAMAVSTYPNIGQMVLSGVASAGAYTAAAVLRSQAQRFENGGIVKGTSYTGDRTWVRANAGELIMNMAQQDTMARILEASVALAELNATNGVGGGITVNLDGASIYGLDEPAVGKAIYDNIEQLKHEGVI